MDNCVLFFCLKEDRITAKWCPWGNDAQILRKGRDARVNNRVWPAYALLPGFSQFWEAGPGMVGESRGESLAHSQRINPYPNQSWLTLRNGSLCRGSLWQGRPGGCSLAAASMGPCVLSMRVGTVKSFGVIPCSWKNSGRVLTFDWLFLGCNRHGWSRDPGWGVSCGVQGQVLLLPKKPMLTALSRRQDQGGQQESGGQRVSAVSSNWKMFRECK